VNTLRPPTFPNWIPAAVREAAKWLHAELAAEEDSAEAREIWSRLVADPRMKRVWGEIYKKKRDINRVFMYPARLTNASNAAALRERARELCEKGGDQNCQDANFLEFEARVIELLPEEPVDSKWSEQDRATQSFFTQAYRIALTPPTFLSDFQPKVIKLREIADKLRTIATELESVRIHVTESYAEKLREVAADCEDDAKVSEPRPANEPWIIVRKRGNLRQRTFVTRLAYTSHLLFGKNLYSTIATVTNIVLGASRDTSSDDQELVDQNVRDILGDNAQQIRPTFGPLIYPMMKVRMKSLA
jgi:hypothetical protein